MATLNLRYWTKKSLKVCLLRCVKKRGVFFLIENTWAKKPHCDVKRIPTEANVFVPGKYAGVFFTHRSKQTLTPIQMISFCLVYAKSALMNN